MITKSFIALTDALGVSDLGFSSRDPEIAALAGGGYVVAWDVDQHDGSKKAVLARVYDANFEPVSDVFQVNEHTANDQENPKIVARSHGGYDIFFSSAGYIDPDTNTWAVEPGLYVRSFDSDGNALGGEMHLGAFGAPILTEIAGGQFMEIYGYSYYSNGDIKTDIRGRLLDANYAVTGASFKVNTDALGDGLMDLAIALLDNGNVVALWSDDGIHGTGTGVWGQILTPGGAKVGDQFLVNTYTDGRQLEQRVDVLEDGNFVVTWKSGYGQDGSDWGQFGQLFAPDGTKVGTEFQVNTVTYGYQYQGTPVALDGGGFVIVYLASNYTTSTSTAVLAQVFGGTGNKIGAAYEVAVVDMVPDNEFWIEPQATALEGGGFAVVWAGGNTEYQIYTSTFVAAQFGTENSETIAGTDAREMIDASGGDDIVAAGGGHDTIAGGAGSDSFEAGSGDDLVYGGSMSDVLIGTAAGDHLIGGSGSDTAFGGAGADEIEGSSGDDVLYGEAGADTLIGGEGDDRQMGGAGADVFFFDDGFGQDIIADFENGIDKIDIDLVASIDSFSDLIVTGTFAGAEISLTNGATDTILLAGVQAGDIDAGDFIFV